MRTTALVLAVAVLVTACGVTAQNEPQPLVTSTADPDPTPTLTERPDPTTTSSVPPTMPNS